MLANRGEDSLRTVDRTLPIAEELELRRQVIELLITRGAVLASLKRVQEAIVLLRGAVAMAAQFGFNGTEIRGRVNLSYAAAADDPELGYTVAREGWELVRRLGARGWFYMLSNAIEFAIRAGDWEWALQELEEAVSLESDRAARLRLAELRGLQGSDVEADIQAVADLVAEATELQWPATIAEVRALVALGHGDAEAALEFARRSYELLTAPDATAMQTAIRAGAWTRNRDAVVAVLRRQEELPGQVSRAAAAEATAVLAALDGRAEATAAFVDAIRRWRELRLLLDVALCATSFVKLLGASSREAQAAAGEAQAFFERVGAVRLRAVLADALDAKTASGPADSAEGRPGPGSAAEVAG
jgi:tetratricopeptide (TPR) repeat protein